MKSLIGLTLGLGLSRDAAARAASAQQRALERFPRLRTHECQVGESRLSVWGPDGAEERLRRLPDGSVVALIGSPAGSASFSDLGTEPLDARRVEQWCLPWDGRVVLVWVSADGTQWRMWNDWLGSIPVYHTPLRRGRLASTLEPVTVAGAAYSAADFFLPGLVSLLANGHYIGDWTLYTDMKTVPPDTAAVWDAAGYRATALGTVQPSDERRETNWDTLVDELHTLARQAVSAALASEPSWLVPLSGGLDSRLIAGIGASLGAEMQAYAWGEPASTEVLYSRQVARALGVPWRHVTLPADFLVRWTPRWADLFGSSMHFHGMYQMAFLDALAPAPDRSMIVGFLGDVLSDASLMRYDTGSVIYEAPWYAHWTTDELHALLRVPIDEALAAIADEVKRATAPWQSLPSAAATMLELGTRQRLFVGFQSTLCGYSCGVATPFLNRQYANFWLSLPRAARDGRRLLADAYRRYFGRLAVIPNTYTQEPFISTGQYLLKRRIAQSLPPRFRRGPFAGFDDVPVRLDAVSLRAMGRAALWPIDDARSGLAEWIDLSMVDAACEAMMRSPADVRPLRKLQSVQTLAFRLGDRDFGKITG